MEVVHSREEIRSVTMISTGKRTITSEKSWCNLSRKNTVWIWEEKKKHPCWLPAKLFLSFWEVGLREDTVAGRGQWLKKTFKNKSCIDCRRSLPPAFPTTRGQDMPSSVRSLRVTGSEPSSGWGASTTSVKKRSSCQVGQRCPEMLWSWGRRCGKEKQVMPADVGP